MKTNHIILNLLTLAVAIGFSGCASSGYKQADKTGAGIADFREAVVEAKQSVDGAMASLDQISESAATDPRAAFEAYSKSVDKVEDARAKAKSRADDVKSQGAAYFKQWEKQLAEITNPEIRKVAEDRKTKLNETFARVGPLLEQAKADFDPFLSDLKDLRTFLGNDLTITGVDAAKGIIKKTDATGVKVQGSLDDLIAEMNSIAATLTPAKAAKK